MILLYKSTQTVKAVSKQRQNSLILRISGALKQISELEHMDQVNVEVYFDEESNTKKIIIQKQD